MSRFLDHPLLEKCRREYATGAFLFREHDTGQSLFLIQSGTVRLVSDGQGKGDYTAAIVGPGDFLGEKVLLDEQPRRRFFSAIADTDVVAVEIGPTEINRLEKEAPYLVKSLFKRSMELAEARLDRANQLIGVLRSSDNTTRFARCLHFLAKNAGRSTMEGVWINSVAESLQTYLDLPPAQIQAMLAVWVDKQRLIPQAGGAFLVPDPARLLDN